MATVLCIGIDDAASKAQGLSLQRAGHSLTRAGDLRQVITACSGIQFDLVVIGQNLPTMEKLRVGDVVRQHCGSAKILELHNSDNPQLPAADAHLRVKTSKPNDLLRAIDQLTAKRRKTA